jgi:UPF0176 protein
MNAMENAKSEFGVPPLSDLQHITAYQFKSVEDPLGFKNRLVEFALPRGIQGLIILAKEGINFSATGSSESLEQFKRFLETDLGFDSLYYQASSCPREAFTRFSVKIRPEIVTFKAEVGSQRAPYITPEELAKEMSENGDLVLLDCRKKMEFKYGSFEGAVPLEMSFFREFSELAKEFPEEWKSKKLVTFCTGGIRCEKAASYLKSQGFEQVYQLHGGIIHYLQAVGRKHWRGECFVFDNREILDAQ